MSTKLEPAWNQAFRKLVLRECGADLADRLGFDIETGRPTLCIQGKPVAIYQHTHRIVRADDRDDVKSIAGKVAAAAVQRICTGCGCRDNYACAGGCAWVYQHLGGTGLCSKCQSNGIKPWPF